MPASASSTAAPLVDQPLSYAEYAVQGKRNAPAPAPPQRGDSSKPLRPEGGEAASLRKGESDSVPSEAGRCETSQKCVKGDESGSDEVKKSEKSSMAGTDQREGISQTSDPTLSLGPKPVGSGNCIIVSPRQVCFKIYVL